MLRFLSLFTLTGAAVLGPWPFVASSAGLLFLFVLAGYRAPDRPAPDVQAELDYRRRGSRS